MSASHPFLLFLVNSGKQRGGFVSRPFLCSGLCFPVVNNMSRSKLKCMGRSDKKIIVHMKLQCSVTVVASESIEISEIRVCHMLGMKCTWTSF